MRRRAFRKTAAILLAAILMMSSMILPVCAEAETVWEDASAAVSAAAEEEIPEEEPEQEEIPAESAPDTEQTTPEEEKTKEESPAPESDSQPEEEPAQPFAPVQQAPADPAGTAEDAGEETMVNFVPRDKIASVSCDMAADGYAADLAVDNNPGTFWHTPWDDESTQGLPHWLEIEFTEPQTIDTLEYLQRQNSGFNEIQFISRYKLEYLPAEGGEYQTLIADGSWERDGYNSLRVKFDAVSVSKIRFTALEQQVVGVGSAFCTSIAELRAGLTQDPTDLPVPDVSLPGVVVQTASSANSGYPKELAADGDTQTFWHSEWDPPAATPHWLEFDLGGEHTLGEIRILPRQDQFNEGYQGGPMAVLGYDLYVEGPDGQWKPVITGGTLNAPAEAGKYATIQLASALSAHRVRLEITRDLGGGNSAIAEIQFVTDSRAYLPEWESLVRAIDDARQTAGSVSVGDKVEQYPKEAYDIFCTAIDTAVQKANETAAGADSFAAAQAALEQAKQEFFASRNLYTAEELEKLIDEAQKLLDGTTPEDGPSEENFAAFRDSIQAARAILSAGEPAAIHQAYKDLMAAKDVFSGKIDTDKIDLAGQWDFYMGAYSPDTVAEDSVTLPGTMDENGKGTLNLNYTDKTRLTPRYYYEGKAVYQKTVTVPDSWADRHITLTLERTRLTTVWVDGQKVGSQNALGVAQVYDLTGLLDPAKSHQLTIEVENANYPGYSWGVHMWTSETQGNWNGIVGEISLTAQEQIYLEDVRIYPDKSSDDAAFVNVARMELDVGNITGAETVGTVTVSAVSTNTDKPVDKREEKAYTITIPAEGDTLELEYPMEGAYLWDEFDSALYNFTITLNSGNITETVQERTGMREYTHDSDHFLINGKTVFLRGEANCAVFPLTGYPPMDKESWLEILGTAQSYGLNHYRFHSWAPPAAAYEAADELGMYLQPELYAFNGDPFTSAGSYFADEAKRILNELASNPSFVMLTFGNETSPSQDVAAQTIAELRQIDGTRQYAAATNSFVWAPGFHPSNGQFWDYQINHTSDRGNGVVRGLLQPSSTGNYYDALDGIEIPFVSHEIGQYQQYPDYSQIDKYTGVFEARNLIIARDSLESKGMLDQYKDFAAASNKLAALCYRAEVETALRTSNQAGYELLGLQDFPGQGSAIVGMLDAFMERKVGAPTGEEFTHYNSAVTALGLLPQYVWTNDQEFTAEYQIVNYGEGDLTLTPTWKLLRADGSVLAQGKGETSAVAQGEVGSVCQIRASLAAVTQAEKLSFVIADADGKILDNQYDIWVYPAQIDTTAPDDVLVVRGLTQEAKDRLAQGGKVLVLPVISASCLPQSVQGYFAPTFWSRMFFAGGCQTMGTLTDPDHPLYSSFPTDFYTNWQWYNLLQNSRPIILDDTGASYRPILQTIDNFGNDTTVDGEINNRKLGLIFEGQVGGGKLLVCSIDLLDVNANRPEAKQLYRSILDYMHSDAFNPQDVLDEDLVEELIVPPVMAEGIAVNTTRTGYPKPFASYSNESGSDGYRLWKINNGNLDFTTSSESWTNYGNPDTSGDHIGIDFGRLTRLHQIDLYVFEDFGCKAPASWKVQYWDGTDWADAQNVALVDDQGTTRAGKQAMTVGKNILTFDPVETEKIRVVMENQPDMYLAIAEMDVHGEYLEEFYRVTVQGGKADPAEQLRKGDTVTLIAQVPEGKKFIRWQADGVTFADAAAATTTFVMPDHDVAVTAVFENSGSGGSGGSGGAGDGGTATAPDASGQNPVSGSSGVRTSDDTPMLVLVLLLIAGTAGAVLIGVYRARRKR